VSLNLDDVAVSQDLDADVLVELLELPTLLLRNRAELGFSATPAG
jgi:hypothetical protein